MIKTNIKNQKGFFKFSLKFILFLCLLFILDYTIGSVLKYLYFKQTSGFLYDITYSIDKTNEDLIVIGSSTVHHEFYPEAFENKLGMSFYNTGNDGTSILYHYAILKGILKRYSPKMIILVADFEGFKKDQQSYDKLSALLSPYYFKNPEIQPILELCGPFQKIKLLSKIYPFNSMLFSLVKRIPLFKNSDSSRKIDDNHGYAPLEGTMEGLIQTDTTNIPYELDENKIRLFKAFIKDCIDSNVNLFIVSTPRYRKYIRKDTSRELAHMIANKFGIPFYDYSSDSLFLNHGEYFHDPNHLNGKASILFSNLIADTIFKSEEYSQMKNRKNLFGKK